MFEKHALQLRGATWYPLYLMSSLSLSVTVHIPSSTRTKTDNSPSSSASVPVAGSTSRASVPGMRGPTDPGPASSP